MADLRIGIDLGGTKIEAIALDRDGTELARPRIETPRHDYDASCKAIRDLVLGLENQLGRTGSVGMGIPGAISPLTGVVKNANSTWLNGKPLDRDISALLERDVRVANDANCFAVSEAVDGAGAGCGLVFGVILGTGVGGGVAIDGAARTGRNAIAGEWGHTPLPWPSAQDVAEGPECYCGRKGCVEQWLSGPGAADEFKRVTGRDLSMPQIIEAYAAHDAQAVAAIDRYVNRLARALAVVVDIIDPDMIVLGGGVSNFAVLYQELPKLLPRWCFSDGIETPVRQSIHGDSSGVRGAAWLWG
jgi:fructokinase